MKIEFDKNNICVVEYEEDNGAAQGWAILFCEMVNRKRRMKIEFDKNFCGVEYEEDDGAARAISIIY
jgi:hypothetical protein